MSKIDGRPQAFVGIGGVVGAETEQQLVEMAKDLAVSKSDRQLVLAVNATHAAQMMDGIDYKDSRKGWNPVGEADYQLALMGGHVDQGVLSIARVRTSREHLANPGYVDFFVDRTMRRSDTWADGIQVDGFTLDQNRDQDIAPLRLVDRFAREYAGEKKLIVGFDLPDSEAFNEAGVVENITTLFARLAFRADYIALNSQQLDADAARTLLDAVYATIELGETGIVIHDASDEAAVGLVGEYPNLSVYAEDSLHVNDSIEVKEARAYVEAALRAAEVPVAEIVK